MDQKVREYIAGYLTCMVKTAVDPVAPSTDLNRTLIGLGLGSGLGGLGGYFGTQAEENEAPRKFKSRRLRNALLGLVGGGATGAIAGYVPSKAVETIDKTTAPSKPITQSLWDSVVNPTTGGGLFGSLMGIKAGLKYVDRPNQHNALRNFLNESAKGVEAHSGIVSNEAGVALKKLYKMMGIDPDVYQRAVVNPKGVTEHHIPVAQQGWLHDDAKDILERSFQRKAHPDLLAAQKVLAEAMEKAKVNPHASPAWGAVRAAKGRSGAAKLGLAGGLAGASLPYLIPYLFGEKK